MSLCFIYLTINCQSIFCLKKIITMFSKPQMNSLDNSPASTKSNQKIGKPISSKEQKDFIEWYKRNQRMFYFQILSESLLYIQSGHSTYMNKRYKLTPTAHNHEQAFILLRNMISDRQNFVEKLLILNQENFQDVEIPHNQKFQQKFKPQYSIRTFQYGLRQLRVRKEYQNKNKGQVIFINEDDIKDLYLASLLLTGCPSLCPDQLKDYHCLLKLTTMLNLAALQYINTSWNYIFKIIYEQNFDYPNTSVVIEGNHMMSEEGNQQSIDRYFDQILPTHQIMKIEEQQRKSMSSSSSLSNQSQNDGSMKDQGEIFNESPIGSSFSMVPPSYHKNKIIRQSDKLMNLINQSEDSKKFMVAWTIANYILFSLKSENFYVPDIEN